VKQFATLTVGIVLLVTLFAVPARPAEPKKPDNNLMKKKLEQSQKVLDGVATEDFKKIEAGAEELIEISKQAEFQAHKTKEYERFMNEFRRSAEGLLEASKKKNIDAAALHYVEMTLTCVKCHKHLRETRMTGLD
jgi:cytochrome c556